MSEEQVHQIKIPREIKVCSHTYKVELSSDVSFKHNSIGIVKHDEQKIIIDSNNAKSQIDQTFLHEYMHLVERFLVVKLDDADVDRIAEGIAILLKNNLNITLDWSDIKEG